MSESVAENPPQEQEQEQAKPKPKTEFARHKAEVNARLDEFGEQMGQILDILKSREAPKAGNPGYDPAEHMADESGRVEMDVHGKVLRGGKDYLEGIPQEDIDRAAQDIVECYLDYGSDGDEVSSPDNKGPVLMYARNNAYCIPRGMTVEVPFFLVLMLTESWQSKYEMEPGQKDLNRWADTQENCLNITRRNMPRYRIELRGKSRQDVLKVRMLQRAQDSMPQNIDSLVVAGTSSYLA